MPRKTVPSSRARRAGPRAPTRGSTTSPGSGAGGSEAASRRPRHENATGPVGAVGADEHAHAVPPFRPHGTGTPASRDRPQRTARRVARRRRAADRRGRAARRTAQDADAPDLVQHVLPVGGRRDEVRLGLVHARCTGGAGPGRASCPTNVSSGSTPSCVWRLQSWPNRKLPWLRDHDAGAPVALRDRDRRRPVRPVADDVVRPGVPEELHLLLLAGRELGVVLRPGPLGHDDHHVGDLARRGDRGPDVRLGQPGDARRLGSGLRRARDLVEARRTRSGRRARRSRPACAPAARFIPAPNQRTPALSRRSIVSCRASTPWSVMWLEASVTTSIPDRARSGATFGSIEKTVPVSCWTKSLVMGHSKSPIVSSASLISVRTAPGVAAADRLDDRPAVAVRAVEAAVDADPGVAGRAAVEDPVPALLLACSPSS